MNDIGIQKLVDSIVIGASIIDIDENMGEGIVRSIQNGWVLIKWSKLAREWGTPLSVVVQSFVQREWILLDNWCHELTIPESR